MAREVAAKIKPSPADRPAEPNWPDLENFPLAVCRIADGHIIATNRALTDLLGYDVPALIGAPLADLGCREVAPSPAEWPQALRHVSGRSVWCIIRCVPYSDSEIWIFEDGARLREKSNELTRLRSRMRAEVERRTVRVRESNREYRRELERMRVFDVGLTQSREKYRVLFQNSQTGIIFVDDQGAISQINNAMRLMIGARNLVEFQRLSIQPICRYADTSEPVSLANLARHLVCDVIGEQARLITVEPPNSKTVWVELKCTRMHVRDFSAALTFHDRTDEVLSERREAEQRRQLNRMGRISLAGHLGSAVAHELGQPLNACMSYVGGLTQRFIDREPSPEIVRHALRQIHVELARASAMLRNMRQFVSNHAPVDELVSMRELVHSTLALLEGNLRDGSTVVHLDLPGEDDLAFHGNAVEIQQVLVNLVMNALDSFQEVALSVPVIEIGVRALSSDLLECRVVDNGPGISSEILDGLFQPYQTSKEQGLGLGLAMSRNIIESHGGKIWVDARRGQGAALHFTLPRSVSEQAS